MQRGLPQRRPIQNVSHVLAVTSAKGGVGKSTLAVNLALSLARMGVSTGILDTDIFGPSIPTLLGLEGMEPALTENNQLVPLTAYGLRAMSMGFLVPQDSPVVWRGMMVNKALQQLLFEVAWPGLDVLVLDLPPGTGDVPLTIAQSIKLAGAVIVSTPQDLALRDAVRGIQMFSKTGVEVLGMVQNMSTFVCDGCGKEHDIFGREGVEKKCKELGIKLLGDVPLHASICDHADKGKPTAVAAPDSQQALAFQRIAQGLRETLSV